MNNNNRTQTGNKRVSNESKVLSANVDNKDAIFKEIDESFGENIDVIEEQIGDFLNNENEKSKQAYEEDDASQGVFVLGQSALTSYMKSMADCKVVTKDEEIRMFQALKNGDTDMVDAIFKANARLVPFVVKRLAGTIINNPSMDFEDLISAGNIGLLKAIGLFDPSKGYKFSTYAYHWIYSFAERAICNDANLIRIPVHLQDKARRVKKAEKELESQMNRELTYDERVDLIEEVLGNSKEVFAMEQYARYSSPISLNTLVSDEDDSSELGDFVASNEYCPEETAFSNTLKKEIIEAMEECLPERNVQIMKLRFGFDSGTCMTLEEVGKIFGVTRERIRQIESKSIRLLRRNRKFRHLQDYMEIK